MYTMLVLVTLLAYFIGSIASAIVVCRIFRLPDPRLAGSQNPGATNVLRLGGKKAGLYTFLGDFLKGLVPLLVLKLFGVPPLVMAFAGLGLFFGHLYPLYFQFKGGKGVATYVGILFAWHWMLGVAFAITALILFKLFRRVSLLSLVGALVTVMNAWVLVDDPSLKVAIMIMSLWIFIRHRSNIVRLIQNTEPPMYAKS